MARIEYGRLSSGQIVRVADARRGVRYTCPTCGLPLELRRGEQLEYFAHWRNLPGTRECELFSPGDGGTGQAELAASPRPVAGVEDAQTELGLVLGQLDGRWGLGLRLPEIPSDELGVTTLSALRSALVDVFAGRDRLVRVSALDLRPGVGTARVDVAPSLQEFRTEASGTWPASIDRERWQLQSRGLDSNGTLFRLRRGEWTRLLARSRVHHGETLLVLADARCAPPGSFVRDVHARFSSGGLQWTVWEVRLPDDVNGGVNDWLARLGHDLLPRPWSVALETPARAYSEQGEPVFWVGDSPVLALEAPLRSADALATFTAGSNAHSASVRAPEGRVAHVGVASRVVGPTRLVIAANRSACLDITFIERPSHAVLFELLAHVPRLRVWVGEQCLEAWSGSKYTVRISSREPLEVRVDLGADSERARVTVWERGKRRSQRGLAAHEIASVVEGALFTASLIEIDADNLGRIELAPLLSTGRATRDSSVKDRLAWRDHLQGMNARSDELTTPTLLGHPRAATSLHSRPVSAAALVRARLALRRRREAGGAL